LQRALPGFNAISEVSSEPEIEQAGQQYEDVPRAIEQPWTIGHPGEVVVKLVHVLAGQKKANHDKYSEYQVRTLHIKEYFSRKGAKRCRVSKGFLCAFAPLREKYLSAWTLAELFVYTGRELSLATNKCLCYNRCPPDVPFPRGNNNPENWNLKELPSCSNEYVSRFP